MQFTNKMQLSTDAYNALKRIRSNKAEEVSLEQKYIKPKRQAQIFEEYSDAKFENKVNIDINIYNQFMKGITEEQLVGVKSLLANMLETTKSIYEHINIEPKIYGFKQLSVDSSEDELQLESKRLLNDHFNKMYYSLTSAQRYETFKDVVVEMAYEYVSEDKLPLADATEHAYKTTIIERFIKTINFPYLIESKINELMESDMYGEMFDRDRLTDLTEQFDEQLRVLSRVFATTI